MCGSERFFLLVIAVFGGQKIGCCDYENYQDIIESFDNGKIVYYLGSLKEIFASNDQMDFYASESQMKIFVKDGQMGSFARNFFVYGEQKEFFASYGQRGFCVNDLTTVRETGYQSVTLKYVDLKMFFANCENLLETFDG